MMNSIDFIKYDSHDISVQLDNCTLIIRYPNVTYSYWKGLCPFDQDELPYILSDLLMYMDCSIELDGKRVIKTSNMTYQSYITDYYYYLLRVDDQIEYNYWFDELLKTHQINVDFEIANPVILNVTKEKTKAIVKKANTKGKFVRQVTTDLITNEEAYIYSNSKTGETINSSDPNLLSSLNGLKPKKEKKVKQSKVVPVNMSAMTFSFNKKKDGL